MHSLRPARRRDPSYPSPGSKRNVITMRKLRYLGPLAALLVAVAVVVAGCGGGGGGGEKLPKNAVAQVGAVTITRPQVDQLIQLRQRAAKAQKQSFPQA